MYFTTSVSHAHSCDPATHLCAHARYKRNLQNRESAASGTDYCDDSESSEVTQNLSLPSTSPVRYSNGADASAGWTPRVANAYASESPPCVAGLCGITGRPEKTTPWLTVPAAAPAPVLPAGKALAGSGGSMTDTVYPGDGVSNTARYGAAADGRDDEAVPAVSSRMRA